MSQGQMTSFPITEWEAPSHPARHFEFSDGAGFMTVRKYSWKESVEHAHKLVREGKAKGRFVDVYMTEWVANPRRHYSDLVMLDWTQRLKWIKRIDW